jgi:hypothetical protein
MLFWKVTPLHTSRLWREIIRLDITNRNYGDEPNAVFPLFLSCCFGLMIFPLFFPSERDPKV